MPSDRRAPPSDPPRSPLSPGAGKNRLVGWGAIADYLDATPRSAQRWELQDGLPVRRIGGNPGGRVFAFGDELDTWLRSRSRGSDPVPPPRPGPRLVPALAVVFLAALVAGFTLGLKRPHIVIVTTILPAAKQEIVIRGRNLGNYVGGMDRQIPYLVIEDRTAGWRAGGPGSREPVTLDCGSWKDTEIVIAGFSGAFGRGRYQLRPGDLISVSVWNPQTHLGPSRTEVRVQASSVQPIVSSMPAGHD